MYEKVVDAADHRGIDLLAWSGGAAFKLVTRSRNEGTSSLRLNSKAVTHLIM